MVKSHLLFWHSRVCSSFIGNSFTFRDLEVAYEFLKFLEINSKSTVCIHIHTKESIHQQTSVQIF